MTEQNELPKDEKRVWKWFWLAWIVSFLAAEGFAIFSKQKGDTLSEHVWDWADFRNAKWSKSRVVGTAGIFGLLMWLLIHFVTGGEI